MVCNKVADVFMVSVYYLILKASHESKCAHTLDNISLIRKIPIWLHDAQFLRRRLRHVIKSNPSPGLPNQCMLMTEEPGRAVSKCMRYVLI